MKGIISDIYNQQEIVVDFELSETPRDMIMRLVNSEPKESIVGLFVGESEYEKLKNGGIIDSQNSTLAVFQKGRNGVILVWYKPIGEQIKNLKADGKEIRFVADRTIKCSFRGCEYNGHNESL